MQSRCNPFLVPYILQPIVLTGLERIVGGFRIALGLLGLQSGLNQISITLVLELWMKQVREVSQTHILIWKMEAVTECQIDIKELLIIFQANTFSSVVTENGLNF